MGAELKKRIPLFIDSIEEVPAPALKRTVISSQKAAFKLTTEILEGNRCRYMPYHDTICRTLDRVINVGSDNHIKRLIINIPPGYGKTASAVWSFIARGFVVNPAARFIHTSYSEPLVLDNSSKVKTLLASEAYEHFNGRLNMTDDTRAKGLWRTDEGGGLRAVQAGGAMTGFRAGQMDDETEFSGAMVIDDPLKPADAQSRLKTSEQNARYHDTIASRLAHEGVPIIVVMQRVTSYPGEFLTNEELIKSGDMCEFLLRGGSGEKWHHLMLPIEIDNSEEYPTDWTHGIPVEHGLPDGPLWEFKHKAEDIERLKQSNIYTYSAQYKQRPKKQIGERIIKGEWFQRYDVPPGFERIEVFMDTAETKKTSSDYSVFLAAGKKGDNIYILDVVRKKYDIPDLLVAARDFWAKWKLAGASKINIEKKSSGTFLVQSMQREIRFTVNPIERNIDKFTRVTGVVVKISDGNVFLPLNAPWVSDFVLECEDFTDNDSHAYDDQVDVLVDSIEIMIHTIPNSVGTTFARGHR